MSGHKGDSGWLQRGYFRDIFRILPSIYDGNFFSKELTTFYG